jgi:large subunit ribosomal protein L6
VSRIGRMPVSIPKGVQVDMKGSHVTVKGPKGEVNRSFHPDMMISIRDGQIVVTRPTDNRQHRALHGLTRALLANMVTGVTEGFHKDLEIHGVGYRADLRGDNLVLHVGFSHLVEITPPSGISFGIEDRGKIIVVEGVDKELVGEMAAKVRRVCPPEPYKGKGIRYVGEYVRHKAGKAGKVVGAGAGA